MLLIIGVFGSFMMMFGSPPCHSYKNVCYKVVPTLLGATNAEIDCTSANVDLTKQRCEIYGNPLIDLNNPGIVMFLMMTVFGLTFLAVYFLWNK